MNHIGVFFNDKVVRNYGTDYPDPFVFLGNFCLTPVRYLFDGNVVTINNKPLAVKHENEFAYRKGFAMRIRVIAAIILLLPGIIIGSAFKGFGYLFESTRRAHRRAITHYTPINRTIGTAEERLDLEGIKNQFHLICRENSFNQPADHIVVYAKEGTEINEDPGFLRLNPKKIILVGAQICHHVSDITRLDDELSRRKDWESRTFRSTIAEPGQSTTFVTQHKVDSVAAALQDVPPRISTFSFQRYNRIYVI